MTGSDARLGTITSAVSKHWVNRSASEKVMFIASGDPWGGPAEIVVDDLAVRVKSAVSALEVRELLSDRDDRHLVVLTPATVDDLGRDVLATAVTQQLVTVDVWESVRTRFAMPVSSPIDGSLVRLGTSFARDLLAVDVRQGWRPAPSGVLSREHVLREMAAGLLNLPEDQVDGAGVTAWTLEPLGGLALRDLPVNLRDPLVEWISIKGGVGVRRLLKVVLAGHGSDAVALGLLVGLSAGKGHGRPDSRAAALLETRIGGRPAGDEVSAWWALVDGWRRRQMSLDPRQVTRVLARTNDLARELDVVDALGDNDVLESTFTSRTRRAAVLLDKAARTRTTPDVMRAEAAVDAAARHWVAELLPEDVRLGMMGLRAVRWLATGDETPANLEAATRWQLEKGSWLDRARQVVANGSSDLEIGAAMARVHAAVSERRTEIDRTAAIYLAHAVSSDQSGGQLVPVEEALTALLPATDQGVALVVLDGMSAAVAHDVAESVAAQGWSEVSRSGARQGLLAGLPTMTEVSRTSLLSGRRTRGDQRTEKVAFQQLLGERARLFHKGDLVSPAGRDVNVDVREALLDGGVGVVGVVLNSIDDSLSTGAPGSTRWDVDTVTHLRQVLELAGSAGRVVVLTSDHGHVVDREDGELRNSPGGSGRWRPATEAVKADEVRLSGPRVLLGDGDVVAAVDESLRYARRTAGYHGGAALAEITIPWMTFVRRGSTLEGLTPVDASPPTWWSSSPMAATDDGLF